MLRTRLTVFCCNRLLHAVQSSAIAAKSRAGAVKATINGACAHYVMVSHFQWQPFWLATQRDPQNDWTVLPPKIV